MTLLITAAISDLINVVLIAGVPYAGYSIYHRWRHKRGLVEVARRAGLQVGAFRFLAHAAVIAALCMVVVLWPPAVEASTREGSAFRSFAALGLNRTSIVIAVLYGVVATGFAVLPVIFVGALVAGWLRIRSASILGPWLIHASANVTMALTVAVRSGAGGGT